jgi:exodeoxyribonuclease X
MYTILDTETASLQGGVCQIAWLRLDEELNILDQFESLVNPEREIQSGAQAIHGISQGMVANSPTMAEISVLLPKEALVVGHNVSFDLRMVKDYWVPKASLCSLALSRQYVKGTMNHKLETLKTELGLSEQVSHSALGDVLTVLDLIKYILPLSGRTLGELFAVALQPKVIHKMPFGKHRGVPLLRVPKDYRDWLIQQDIDKDLKYSLEQLNEL